MPTSAPPGSEWPELVSHLRADQSQRWQRGERVRVESYLARYPHLDSESRAFLALVDAEVFLRRSVGDEPTLEEYLARFPQHAEPLRRRWAIHELFRKSDPERTIPGRFPCLAESHDQQDGSSGSHETRDQDDPLAPGLPRVCGYEILETLGRGGMGVVYKALQAGFDRLVALKMIRERLFEADGVARFRNELLAVGRITHPFVVAVHAIGQEQGRPYFVMEYLAGGSLADLLKRGRLEPRRAAELVAQAARGVQAAHDQGIVHRDLKPGNILLDEFGDARVADFGLARLADSDASLTATGAVMGTPAYMAPEQASGEEVDESADVWALGAILYECLTRRPPFQGANRQETLRRVRFAQVVRPRDIRPDVPMELERICLGCLQKEPSRRFPRAIEIAHALERYLRGDHVEKPRRAWVAALACLAVLLGGAALALGPERKKEDQGLILQQKAQERKKPIPLFERDMPLRQRWVVGPEFARDIRVPDGSFTISSPCLALLELASDPGHQRFRFRAKVRHRKAGDMLGLTGLYVAHKQVPLADGSAHLYTSVLFNDVFDEVAEFDNAIARDPILALAPRPTANQLNLVHTLYTGDGYTPDRGLEAGGAQSEAFTVDPKCPVWRPITVEVTPQGVRVFWDNAAVPTLVLRSADMIDHMRDAQLKEKPHWPARNVKPEFVPRGGVGLIVACGTASFRDVVIEPLP